jgi:aminopeptidase
MIAAALRSVFTVNLRVKQDEKVLVFTDTVSDAETVSEQDRCRRERLRDLALLTSEVGRTYSKKILYQEFPSTGSHGAEPPERLWRIAFGERAVEELKKGKLLDSILKKKLPEKDIQKAGAIIGRHKRSAAGAVVALSNYSTSHTQFRSFLTNQCGSRYASMPLFDFAMLEGPMGTDWVELSKKTQAITKIVNKAETLVLSTANGSKMTMSKKDRKALADTGILTKPGAFGNLPAGEVFFAPVEGTAEGTLVIEWAPTRKLNKPVTLTVKDGMVQEVYGSEPYADVLRAKLAERPENSNIAELGIGTNSRATRPDNILESEKILGTIHIALGDNSSFGGKIVTPFHQDFVFFKPTVTLVTKDNSTICLLKNGVMCY